MTDARKIRIWNREKGLCRICGKPVPHKGTGVRYDHYSPFWISRDDSDENLFPLHTACDAEKTYGKDLGDIAKIKRIIVKHDPDREKKPSRIQGRGFEKPTEKKPWPKRSFPKRSPP